MAPVLSAPWNASPFSVLPDGAPQSVYRPSESATAVRRRMSVTIWPRCSTHSGHCISTIAPGMGASSLALRTLPTIAPLSAACGPRQLPVTSVRADGVASGTVTTPGSLITICTMPGSRRSESSTGCRNVASHRPAGTLS